MNATSRVTRGPIVTVLVAGTVGWLLFVTGVYLDVRLTSGLTQDELYGPAPVGLVYPSKYLTFLAIASLALGALVAKRRLTSAAQLLVTARPVLTFSNVVMIVSLLLAAVAGVAVFMDGFFSTPDTGGALVRAFNLYVPIVLYTALLVTVLLFGFVFVKSSVKPVTAPTPAVAAEDPHRRRALALAFTLPIVAIAVALILGLIVYDVTRTAPEVWIWVIIQLIVAIGVTLGTWFARASLRSGARQLNTVLAVIFVAVVTIMSLSYGTSATQRLSASPHLALSMYEDEWGGVEDRPEGTPVDRLTINTHGYDLERNAPVTAVLVPSDEILLEGTVDRHGNLSVQEDFRPAAATGEYTIEIAAPGAGGDTVRTSLDIVFLDGGRVSLPDGAYSSFSTDSQQLLPISVHWVFGDLLPAFMLWILVCAVIFLTLSARPKQVT